MLLLTQDLTLPDDAPSQSVDVRSVSSSLSKAMLEEVKGREGTTLTAFQNWEEGQKQRRHRRHVR